MDETARIILAIGAAYILTGAAVAAWFAVISIDKHDAAAAGSFAFRPLLLPGLCLLWPLVVLIVWRSKRPAMRPPTAGAHLTIWVVVAAVMVLTFAAAWRASTPPADLSSRRLEAPRTR